jgi:ADP-heptose:LPS heptosyltransferase
VAGGRVLTTGFAGGAPPGARTTASRRSHVHPHRHPPDRPLGSPLVVLRALGLGDFLTAVPALRALDAAFPNRPRVLASPRALAPLVELAAPGFQLLDVPVWVGGVPPDPAVAARLPHGALAVNLHGRGPESHRLLLATAPERLIGFETADGPRWDEREHEVERWCRLLGHYGIPADRSALDLALPDAPARGPDGPTLIHPGAASAARRWPAERWAQVARGERARGRDVLLSGSAQEAPLTREIVERAGLPRSADRAGTSGDLAGLARLVASAGRVVCGDTGVAHLATALRVPSVVLFGPTDPARWGPPSDRPWHRVLWAGTSGDPHAERIDPGLLAIDSAAVLDALSASPEPPPRRRPPAAQPAR